MTNIHYHDTTEAEAKAERQEAEQWLQEFLDSMTEQVKKSPQVQADIQAMNLSSILSESWRDIGVNLSCDRCNWTEVVVCLATMRAAIEIKEGFMPGSVQHNTNDFHDPKGSGGGESRDDEPEYEVVENV